MTTRNTNTVYVSCSKGDCIEVLQLDRESGEMAPVETVQLPGNGMPLAVAPDKRHLYAAIASDGRDGGPQYMTFEIEPVTGQLIQQAIVAAPGRMSHITVDHRGRYLLGASVSNDLVSSNFIDQSDGALHAEPVDVRKVPSKAHQITLDKTNRFAFVPNLGADLVMQLKFAPETGRLFDSDPSEIQMPKGAAPRHIAHHPSGNYVYLLNEEDGSLVALALDADTGTLAEIDRSSILPDEFTGDPWGAQILITPDGKFLYTSERTSSTILLHEIDAATGRMTRRSGWPTEACPRNFAIDASGQWLVVAGEKSNRVSAYAIDCDTGNLTFKSSLETGAGPLWIEVIELA